MFNISLIVHTIFVIFSFAFIFYVVTYTCQPDIGDNTRKILKILSKDSYWDISHDRTILYTQIPFHFNTKTNIKSPFEIVVNHKFCSSGTLFFGTQCLDFFFNEREMNLIQEKARILFNKKINKLIDNVKICDSEYKFQYLIAKQELDNLIINLDYHNS